MGRMLTVEEINRKLGDRFILLEEWKGIFKYHWFYDKFFGIKIWCLPRTAMRNPRKRPSVMPKRKHGCTYEPWFNSYEAMIRRCSGKHHRCYNNVKVCKEWEDNPRIFGEWAMANGFEVGLTIDRIDPSKGYFPENCRWITLSENVKRTHISSPRLNRDSSNGRYIKIKEAQTL